MNIISAQEQFVTRISDKMGRTARRIMNAIIKEHALSEDEFWKRVYAVYSDVDADFKMNMSIEELQDISEFIELVRRYM